MNAPRADVGRKPDWRTLKVCVAGIGTSGRSVARTLLDLGAAVTVVDARTGDDEQQRAAELRSRGAAIDLGDGTVLPAGTDLVVTSPGWPPTASLLCAAADRGVPIWGDVELAWRLADPNVPWLSLTGTNGKTTSVRMLAAMLTADGHRCAAVGNVGTPVLDAVVGGQPYDVLAVELSSFQLHWTSSVQSQAAAILNIAPDHLDWHGSMHSYTADKALIYRGDPVAVYNADDLETVALAAPIRRRVGFTLAEPARGCLGVIGNALVDRAFGAGDTLLADVDDVQPAAPHNVANALAAAALARSYGVRPEAIRAGLLAFRPDPHRIADVATVDGVGTSTIRKRPIHTPLRRRWRRTHASSGSLVASPRTRHSTTSYATPRRAYAEPSCSAETAPSSVRHCDDTHRMCR